ncbi:MAG: sensor histidine kinase N-terminal domain-containing protein [Planctomycetes bacterium]|nr:sensor histidine kinase N-terminal domain-containing protein [Planctomycetota bacterium]
MVRARSLRLRLCVALAASFLVLLGGVAWWVTAEVRRHVTADFDAGLVQRARQLASLCEAEADGRIEFDYVARFHPEFEREGDPDYFQIWLPEQGVTFRSARLQQDLIAPPPYDVEPRMADVALGNGRQVRVAWAGFVAEAAPDEPLEAGEPAGSPPAALAPPPPPVVIAVGRGREHLDTLLARASGAIVGGAAIAVLFAALLVWWIVARGLRPVGDLAAQVARMSPADLEREVALPWTPGELAPVVEQLNAFVRRLRAAMARERRFAGNVAHELRTPVAELRSLAAVALRWPDDVPDGFFGDVRDIAAHMDAVITNLLLLARCHSGREPVLRARVAVLPLVRAAWQRHAARAGAVGRRFELAVADDLEIVTDADKFAIVVDNLVGNAASHALPDSVVRCRAVRDGGLVRIAFENAAEPMSAAELEHLTEPFWRRDAARAGGEHAGLGLALVSACGELLELEVGFEQGPDGVFRATVVAPAAPLQRRSERADPVAIDGPR